MAQPSSSKVLMATSSRRFSKMASSTLNATFTELFLSNPSLLSHLLRFIPWRVFLSLSQTCRSWRGFLESADSRKTELRNVVLTRYVDGFGKVLREAEPSVVETLGGVQLCWQDLVLLLISQQTPLHTYPTFALSVLSSSSVPETSRRLRHSHWSLKTAHFARLALAHSRFVLVLQSIAHSSFRAPPREDDLSPPLSAESPTTGSSRGHSRASSAGSIRELVFPTPLATIEHPPMQLSQLQPSVDIDTARQRPGHSRFATTGPNTLSKSRRGSKNTANSFPNTSSLSTSASSPSISMSPTSPPKMNKRMSVASLLGKSPRTPPPPTPEFRALRTYSSNFGWRRGLNDARGKWDSSYRSSTMDSDTSIPGPADDTGSEMDADDDEIFFAPRRMFASSDARVSGSESSFSEGAGSIVSASTSASNSTSATSISDSDSPPMSLQKELPITGAEVLALNRDRIRPAFDAQKRSKSVGRSRPASPPSTMKPIRPSTLGPGVSKMQRERLHLSSVDLDRNNPHALRLATSRTRAPVLRVFVPSLDMSLPHSPSDDGGISGCEEELLRAGLWEHLSIGDVVCNLGYVPPTVAPSSSSSAVWLVYNGYQLVPFAPGSWDKRGILPVYLTPQASESSSEGQEPWALPSWGYYEHLLGQELGMRPSIGGQKPSSGTMNINVRFLLSRLPISPLHFDMMREPALISIPTLIPSVHTPGGFAVVKKWVWTLSVWVGSLDSSGSSPSQSFNVGNIFEIEVGTGWEGEWVLEGDGTKEGKEMLLSCLRRDQNTTDLMEWELVRDRCSRRKVWMRLLNPSVSAPL
ncbi:hypothetical protein BDP27DRAFT_1324395, partial [Rhodocollybia butyracea]